MERMPTRRPAHLQRLETIDAICARFEAACKQGDSRPEAFLDEADPADRPALLEELLLLEWTYGEKRGERPAVQQDRVRFRSLIDAVESAWQRWLTGTTISPAPDPASPSTVMPAGRPTTHPSAAWPAQVPVLPGYQNLKRLGEGGMGVVYRALQPPPLNREVALKMIKAEAISPDRLQRFRTEAQALARLEHPHIVRVYAWEEVGTQPILVLEYVAGGTLEERLASRGTLPAGEAARLVAILARAVQYAHATGIVHRDLKPGNVLLAVGQAFQPDSAEHVRLESLTYVPKLTDFGLAQLLDAECGQTVTGAIVGTPNYMAPEQAAGRSSEVGPKTDVWALGVILYRCLTGEVPFKGDSVSSTLSRVKTAAVPPLSVREGEVPGALAAICLRCLQKRPKDRPTAAELSEMLERFLAGQSVRIPVKRATRWWTAAAAVLVLTYWVALAVFLRMHDTRSIQQARARKHADSRPPTGPPAANMVVEVYHKQDAQWRSIDTPGALPARWKDLIRVEVKLDRPAYSYLVLMSSQGEVIPLYPWNEGPELKVEDVNAPPPVHLEQSWTNPRPGKGTHVGWEMDEHAGLETLLLLVREEPLPAGLNLRQLIGEVPSGEKAPLGSPGEAALLAMERGEQRSTSLLSLKRGIGKKAVEVDAPLEQLMKRLQETFVVQRAARFAHVAK